MRDFRTGIFLTKSERQAPNAMPKSSGKATYSDFTWLSLIPLEWVANKRSTAMMMPGIADRKPSP